MTQGSGTYVCPKGHVSAEPDYCSECGAKLGGATADSSAGQGGAGVVAGELCPDCGTLREQGGTVFCEVCGYNFATGAHGEVGIVAAPPFPPAVATVPDAQQAEAPAQALQGKPTAWAVTIIVDPSLRSTESPEPPTNVSPFTVALEQPVSLIGRTNEARAIFPEIALPHDEAVSRRHALLQLDAQGALSMRDIGAANGTRLNGKDLQPMVDYPLKDGDEITLGHWSRIRVETR